MLNTVSDIVKAYLQNHRLLKHCAYCRTKCDDEHFKEHAQCRNADTKIFFPDPGNAIAMRKLAHESYCSKCIVRRECLLYALKHEEFGIWSSTLERERARMLEDLSEIIIRIQ